MSSVHLDSNNDEDYLQPNTYTPTVELSLSALELEFDQHLSSVMGNLFDDELTSLHDLEPIATTIRPLPAEPKITLGRDNTLSAGFETNRSPKNNYAAMKNPRSRSSDLAHAVASGSGLRQNEAVITRSTRMPALPITQSVDETCERTFQSTGPAREETIIRSTNIGAVPSTSTPIFGRSSPAVPPETITQSTIPADSEVQSAGCTTASLSPGVGVSAETVRDLEDLNAHNCGALGSSTIPISSFFPQPHASPSEISQIHHLSSYLTPIPLATESFPFTGVVDGDVEMSCLDLPSSSAPEILCGVPRGSFQAAHNHNFVMYETGSQHNTLPASWDRSRFDAASFSSDPSPRTSTFASQPGHIYPVPFASDLNPLCSEFSSQLRPHPSIFDLIQNESSGPALRRPNAYIIPPVAVPYHVWQEESTRQRLRNSADRSKVSKRSRLSAPYFLRTPLVITRSANRSKKARINQISLPGSPTIKPGLNYEDKPPQIPTRAPSPAFSCSSEVSSTSSGSFIATSTYSSDRKLSSPPPLRQRMESFTPHTYQYRGAFKFLRSMSWLWSGQA
ncbi:hypothetical protein B0H14DRAFT_3866832 [Mycena olivaceomarginata]|nr:hypothetical protein B0H14DRAFT_3866832 [Mycena olivaceomarginata]